MEPIPSFHQHLSSRTSRFSNMTPMLCTDSTLYRPNPALFGRRRCASRSGVRIRRHHYPIFSLAQPRHRARGVLEVALDNEGSARSSL